MTEISEQTKNLMVQFQTYQQQLQSILIQKESLNLQNLEIERALEELDKTKQTDAYKITGQIMIKKPVAEIKGELNETKEGINVRIKSLEKTELKLNEKLKELQAELKKTIK